MTKKRATSGRDEVDAFLKKLEHPLKAEIEAVRAIILGADASIGEGVKWNAPSFHVREHFATFHLRPPTAIQLVFHTGAKPRPDAPAPEIQDPGGLLRWMARDRCVVALRDMKEVRAKKAALAAIVRQWIRYVQ